jgi:large subunit ribosomal protein L1
MAKRGKRYTDALKLVEGGGPYDPDDALELVRQTSNTKFDASVELHLRLGLDTAHQDQQLRGTVSLPHGTGRTARVIVFASGDKAVEARDAGADEVGGDELAAKIQGGWLDFDAAVATPDMMRVVSPLGRVLGPRGLMPNARAGTVSPDVGKVVAALKAGQFEYRADTTGNVHFTIGRVSFSKSQLGENLATALDAVVRGRPDGAKGTYIESVTLTTTMGPALPLKIQEATDMARQLS